MPCRIIVLIGNDYFNDKKYSGPIVLGDYVKKGSVWSHKTMFSVHVDSKDRAQYYTKKNWPLQGELMP